jgi:hypothetical protein
MGGLQVAELGEQAVEGLVGDLRPGQDVVEALVPPDFLPQGSEAGRDRNARLQWSRARMKSGRISRASR